MNELMERMEKYCEQLLRTNDNSDIQAIQTILSQFIQNDNFFDQALYILRNSTNFNCIFIVAKCISNYLSDKSILNKVELSTSICMHFFNDSCSIC